jgi:hypothetical protein
VKNAHNLYPKGKKRRRHFFAGVVFETACRSDERQNVGSAP